MSDKETILSDEPVITYSVKDILGRIEAKLDAVTGALTGRMDKIEERVGVLESETQHRKANKDDLRWRLMAFASLAGGLGALIALLVHG